MRYKLQKLISPRCRITVHWISLFAANHALTSLNNVDENFEEEWCGSLANASFDHLPKSYFCTFAKMSPMCFFLIPQPSSIVRTVALKSVLKRRYGIMVHPWAPM